MWHMNKKNSGPYIGRDRLYYMYMYISCSCTYEIRLYRL